MWKLYKCFCGCRGTSAKSGKPLWWYLIDYFLPWTTSVGVRLQLWKQKHVIIIYQWIQCCSLLVASVFKLLYLRTNRMHPLWCHTGQFPWFCTVPSTATSLPIVVFICCIWLPGTSKLNFNKRINKNHTLKSHVFEDKVFHVFNAHHTINPTLPILIFNVCFHCSVCSKAKIGSRWWHRIFLLITWQACTCPPGIPPRLLQCSSSLLHQEGCKPWTLADAHMENHPF